VKRKCGAATKGNVEAHAAHVSADAASFGEKLKAAVKARLGNRYRPLRQRKHTKRD